MYLNHFGLNEFPFRLPPDPALLFWTASHHRAFDLLNRAAHGGHPITMIVGEPGTGKTTLLQHFKSGLPKDTHLGMISNYSSGLGGLGHWLHWAFNLRPQGPEAKLRTAFKAYLVAKYHEGVRCLLIVDEAQNLSDDDISALTCLTQLMAPIGVSMRLVLAGQPRLNRRLPVAPDRGKAAEPALVRIVAMSPEDVGGYIHHRMAVSGCRKPVFDDEAMGRIARIAVGVPRLVNVLCELLLTSAFGAGVRKIDSAFVDRVLEEVRQTGMLDHLLVRPRHSTSATRPAPIGATSPAQPTGTACTNVGPLLPPARGSELIALDAPVEPEARHTSANMPAQPSSPIGATASPIELGRPRKRAAGLALVAVVAVVAAMAVLSNQLIAPGPTVAAPRQGATTLAPLAVNVGPALSVPASLEGADAASLRDQALFVGTKDPLAAAIGFARAALRGDTRAAFYLGQHFETGDGVPRNVALASAWYALASETQPGARRALESLTETTGASHQAPTVGPLPLTGIISADGQAEFIWAAADGTAAHYLIELADAPDAQAFQYGPFYRSAALLDPVAPTRLWRVLSLDHEGTLIGASEWHLIGTDGVTAIGTVR